IVEMNFVEFVDVDAFPAAARTGRLQRKEAKQRRLDTFDRCAVHRCALLHRHPLPGADVIIETASGFVSQPGTFQESTVMSRYRITGAIITSLPASLPVVLQRSPSSRIR